MPRRAQAGLFGCQLPSPPPSCYSSRCCASLRRAQVQNFLLRYKIRAQKCRFCARKARKRGSRRVKAHKNPDFVLEKSQNQGNIAVSDTKMPILCSKRPKMGVPKAKKAQKPRFCARNARKWGFQTRKAHKNLDFVLEMPENGGSEGQKRTKRFFVKFRAVKLSKF